MLPLLTHSMFVLPKSYRRRIIIIIIWVKPCVRVTTRRTRFGLPSKNDFATKTHPIDRVNRFPTSVYVYIRIHEKQKKKNQTKSIFAYNYLPFRTHSYVRVPVFTHTVTFHVSNLRVAWADEIIFYGVCVYTDELGETTLNTVEFNGNDDKVRPSKTGTSCLQCEPPCE